MESCGDCIAEDVVVLIQRDKTYRPFRLKKGRKVRFYPDGALGLKFGSCFKVEEQQLKWVGNEVQSLEYAPTSDSTFGPDNRMIQDDGKAQELTEGDISIMKGEGVSGQGIVSSMIEHSNSFKDKTKFSQEKYIKKKERKYDPIFRIVKTTTILLCDLYFSQNPTKTYYLRTDALSQILTMSNTHAQSNMIVMETCQGLVTGAMLERMGGCGNLVQVFYGDFPVRTILDNFGHLSVSDKSILMDCPFQRMGAVLREKEARQVVMASKRLLLNTLPEVVPTEPVVSAEPVVLTESSSGHQMERTEARSRKRPRSKRENKRARTEPDPPELPLPKKAKYETRFEEDTWNESTEFVGGEMMGSWRVSPERTCSGASAGEEGKEKKKEGEGRMEDGEGRKEEREGRMEEGEGRKEEGEGRMEEGEGRKEEREGRMEEGEGRKEEREGRMEEGEGRIEEREEEGRMEEGQEKGEEGEGRKEEGQEKREEREGRMEGREEKEVEGEGRMEGREEKEEGEGRKEEGQEKEGEGRKEEEGQEKREEGEGREAGNESMEGVEGERRGEGWVEKKEGAEEHPECVKVVEPQLAVTESKSLSAMKRERKKEREEGYRVAQELLGERNMDGLVVVCHLHPEPVVMTLLKFLAPSRPFVVYCHLMEPLVQCYKSLKESNAVFNLQISETWMRHYQVLPDRTHPEMIMGGQSGFILTGITVCSDQQQPTAS